MLFDLRGRGRRRTVQVIYLTLAILMGGGLVLFGIGGATSGGLIDAISGNGGTSTDKTFEDRATDAQKRIDASPTSVVAWRDLARAEYQLAGTGDNFDSDNGTFTADGKAQLRKADAAWQRYLKLVGEKGKVDGPLASQMVTVYSSTGLNQPDKAVSAQEYVLDTQPPSSGLFANLAVLAYQAGQTRKGDLASARAVELASDDTRDQVKAALEQAKTTAAGGTAAPATTTAG